MIGTGVVVISEVEEGTIEAVLIKSLVTQDREFDNIFLITSSI